MLEPLLFDLFADPPGFPPLPAGSDYWLDKLATDVVIHRTTSLPRAHIVRRSDGIRLTKTARAVLDEAPETVRAVAALSASLTVNASAVVAIFASIV